MFAIYGLKPASMQNKRDPILYEYLHNESHHSDYNKILPIIWYVLAKFIQLLLKYIP